MEKESEVQDRIFAKLKTPETVEVQNRAVNTPKSDVVDTSKLDENIPVSLYESRFHRPYASEFFGLTNNLFLQLDNDTLGRLQTIDKFMVDQIHQNNLEDSKMSYNELMSQILNILGINPNEKASTKIDKVHTVVLLRRLFNK